MNSTDKALVIIALVLGVADLVPLRGGCRHGRPRAFGGGRWGARHRNSASDRSVR